MLFTLDIGTIDFRFSSLLKSNSAFNKTEWVTHFRYEHHLESLLLEEPLLVFLALIVAVDDLQEEAGQGDQLAVWSRKEALQEAVTRLIEQNKDGQWIFHLEQKI